MNGLINADMVESAVKVFEAMREVNVRPDSFSYNTVIKGYCKVGKTRKALEMIREMEAGDDGRNVGPDKVSYMTVMQACYGEGDVDCCVSLYHEMNEKGLVVPPHAYSLVVCGLCRQGKVVEGLNVFEEMRRDSCRANKAVYTALIYGYEKTGNVDGTMRLFERMRQEGIKLDEVTYGAIVNGLCKGGRVEEALGYLEFCKENGVMVNAVDKGCPRILIAIMHLSMDGVKVKEACKLADGIVDKGREISGKVRTLIINALRKAGNADLAIRLMYSKIGIEHDWMHSLKKRVKFQTLIDS
ncbi:hypothetical protein AHAS_Ahas16G0111600 [Arachis hypogaea]